MGQKGSFAANEIFLKKRRMLYHEVYEAHEVKVTLRTRILNFASSFRGIILEPPLTLFLSPEGRGNKRLPLPRGRGLGARGY
jgi:hypothetical protein